MKSFTLKTMSRSERIGRVFLIIMLLFFVILSVMPFIYMAIISLMDNAVTMKITWDVLSRTKWSFRNFARVLGSGKFTHYIFNSVIVTLISCVVSCSLSSLAAYGFAKHRFPGNKLMYNIYLLTYMVPAMVFMIPLYLLIKKMGMINTYWGIAAPYAATAFGVILLHSFMKNVPDELLEAADIDGCSEFGKFFHIVLPLIKPALISLTIFNFISCWGAFLWPLISTTKADMNVITIAVSRLKTARTAADYGYVMAGTTISFLPPFLLYVFLQKEFVEGIALSGTKG